MIKPALLSIMLLFALVASASAQAVIYNPGRCAQYYPNANCQNLGPGNPYTSYGWQTNGGWRRAHAWAPYPPRRIYRHYRRY